jgi:hypothetical protein
MDDKHFGVAFFGKFKSNCEYKSIVHGVGTHGWQAGFSLGPVPPIIHRQCSLAVQADCYATGIVVVEKRL